MEMPMMAGFTPMTAEQHIEVLKAREASVTEFTTSLTALLIAIAPSQFAKQICRAANGFNAILNFDTDRSIAMLTKQLEDRPQQIIQQLAMLAGQRDLYEGQMKIFQDNLASAKAEHQEVINALAPLLNLVGQVLGNSLQSVNQEMARLEKELEAHDRKRSQETSE